MISDYISENIAPQMKILNMVISENIALQMKILNMVIPILMHLQSRLKLKRCKLHKAAHHTTKCNLIDVVKLFETRKFLMLSNQTLHYKSKCIRICNEPMALIFL